MASLALTSGIRRRPAAVLQLIDHVSTLSLPGLARSARDVLIYLASLADARQPQRPMWPKRETIARVTGLSEPTVYRALRALEASGFIERLPQENNGAFGQAQIRLSATALPADPEALHADSEVGHEQPPTQQGGLMQAVETGSSDAPSITMIDAPYVDQFEKEESKGLSPQPSSKKPKKRTALPSALTWLVDQGYLEKHQVLSLLSIAKRSKVWLQDILSAKREQIAQSSILIKNLYAYLRYLIMSGTDWRAHGERIRAQENVDEHRKAEQERLVEAQRQHAGRTYRHVDGRRFSVTASGTMLYVFDAEDRCLGASPMSLDFDDAVRAGRIST